MQDGIIITSPPIINFCYYVYFLLLEWPNFHVFLLASERRLQPTPECDFLVRAYVKVTKDQSFFGYLFQNRFFYIGTY